MVLNVTSSFLQSVGAAMESNATYNETRSPGNSTQNAKIYAYDPTIQIVVGTLLSFGLFFSLLGMAGNGMVIWILCFHTKMTSFTTYIFNLSVADFAFLTTLVLHHISMFIHYLSGQRVLFTLLNVLQRFTFSTSQFLLTAISVDRSVCLFFPLWHKCHRPPYLSTTVCVAIWILNFLFAVLDFALAVSDTYAALWRYQFLLNAVLCMPAMLISAIAMLIKVCFMSPHHKRGKFVTVILLALLFFLIFAFPWNVCQFLLVHHREYIVLSFYYIYLYSQFAAIINSAINPVIYFLVGRDKKAQSRRSIKKILEQLFQEEEQASPREET